VGTLAAFLGGLAAIYLALASPIEPFSSLLLQVHMLQHLLLMMVAPPLFWLGMPLFPCLRGLPAPIRTYWIVPLFRSAFLRKLGAWLTHPARALVIFIAVTWIWHIPPTYDLAMRSSGWHYLQHLCFLGSGLIFWYPVVRPYPSRPRWSAWLLAPYLILADVENTVLSALLTFSNRVLYTHYEQVPRLGELTALDDQAAAGVLMWVPGSIAFLVPLFVIGIRLLYPPRIPQSTIRTSPSRPQLSSRISLPLLSPTLNWVPPSTINHSPSTLHAPRSTLLDILCIPLLGPFLKWRHARLTMQIPVALAAAALIVDGLRGPQLGSMNLAGVLPWTHWRGIIILGLLAAGNVFCMACPFVLPRTLARRWLPGARHWPRWLRSKWLAVGLLVVFLWAYEAFSLWDSPWWTAWITIGYFVMAFVIDAFFRGGTFCKYVCPIGQFNFVQSFVSPLEVKVRDPHVCDSCHTKDCIRGRDGIPGCELKLALPRKAGNMDCTGCLDCIHACPHDNIGIAAGIPGNSLWHDPLRSGVGKFSKRPDLAALVVVLTFGAFANAAGMTEPVLAWEAQLGDYFGHPVPLLITSLFYLAALVVLPIGAIAVASSLGSHGRSSRLETATLYSFALVPIGFSMWLAHYSFHFLTSYETVVPVTQRFVAEFGWASLGTPRWEAACCRPVGSWLPRLEVIYLDFGLLLSLYTGYRIARLQSPGLEQALRGFVPWAVLIGLLFAAGIWLVFQPMQMRGAL
jgi:cytochrome c oxidase assembly factor CtaG/ferredoxin